MLRFVSLANVAVAFAVTMLPGLAVGADINPGSDSYNVYNPKTYDVCQIKFTMQHYQEGQCFEIDRPLRAGSSETFKLRSVVMTNKLVTAAGKETMVLIPGGPGESSGLLRYALNSKDLLNAFIVHLHLNVVMFDPRGTGTSVLPQPAENYGKAEFNSEIMVEDLRAVIDATSPAKPVILFAHSAGGMTALKFAALYPERVSKIVLNSVSVSPERAALMNQSLYGAKPRIWEQFKASVAGRGLDLANLERKYFYVEDVLVQQFKAKVLKKYEDRTIKKTPLDFRGEILAAMGGDPTGQDVAALINKNYGELASLPIPELLVLPPLRALKIGPRPDDEDRFKAAEWIKAAVNCGEGMTAEMGAEPSVFDGLPVSWFCGKFSTEHVVGFDLSTVKTPVLYLAGARDSHIPLAEVQRTVGLLPNAKLVVDAKAGHMMFIESPGTLYFSMEKFLGPTP